MLKWIYSQILCPNCLKCGSMFVGPSFFCELCTAPVLQSIGLFKYRLLVDVKVFCMFNWENDPQLISKQMITLLKSYLSEKSWQFYTSRFKKRFSGKDCVLVIPVPGSSWRSFHTNYFAKALAQQLDAEVVAALFKSNKAEDPRAQKLKTKLERQNVFIGFHEKFTKKIHSADLVILVDDILTTGSTIKAAISQLKPCLSPNAELFSLCLFSRSSKTSVTEPQDLPAGESVD